MEDNAPVHTADYEERAWILKVEVAHAIAWFKPH